MASKICAVCQMPLFIVDVGYEKIAVQEANKLGIPVIGVVDTNNSLQGVDYIIPGNDDAIRAIQLYVSATADAINEGHTSAAVAPREENMTQAAATEVAATEEGQTTEAGE